MTWRETEQMWMPLWGPQGSKRAHPLPPEGAVIPRGVGGPVLETLCPPQGGTRVMDRIFMRSAKYWYESHLGLFSFWKQGLRLGPPCSWLTWAGLSGSRSEGPWRRTQGREGSQLMLNYQAGYHFSQLRFNPNWDPLRNCVDHTLRCSSGGWEVEMFIYQCYPSRSTNALYFQAAAFGAELP